MKVRIVEMSQEGKLTATVVELSELGTWMKNRGQLSTGEARSRSERYPLRSTLVGKPTFTGFYGPMHEVIEGEDAIRYESNDAYRSLSA